MKNTITGPANPTTIAKPEGRLLFRDVHFRYQDSPAQYADLIDGVQLELEPGETMALVGLTGSGKSTITALTSRMYDVTGGAIEIDGVDIRDLSLFDLRSHIAMAFEDATLFSASVRDNVMLGRPDGSDDEPAKPWTSPRRTSSSTCPRASTLSSAKKDFRSLAVSGNGWHSPVLLRRSHPSWFWMIRCRHWMSTPKPSSRQRCVACSRRRPR